MVEKLAQAGEGGGVHAHPPPANFQYIYHHKQSCGVRSSWEGRYTPPISTLPLHVLCVQLLEIYGKTSFSIYSKELR